MNIKGYLYFIAIAMILWFGLLFFRVYPFHMPVEGRLLMEYSCSQVCHQDPAKTITLLGAPFPVCMRCSGIYSGAFLSSLLFIFYGGLRIKSARLFYIAAGSVIADVLMHNFGFYGYSFGLAFLTGLFSGSVSFLYLYSVTYEHPKTKLKIAQ